MTKKSVSQRGTASVEIVVMLPFFLALLGAVFYLHGLAAATQAAGMAARSCAWSYALAGCEGSLPPICEEIGLGKPEGLRIGLPGSELEIKPNGEMDFDGSWFDAVADIPVLGAVVKGIFGVGKRIKATRKADEFMGDDKEVVTASTYVLCNTKAESWSDQVSKLFTRLLDCNEKTDALCKD